MARTLAAPLLDEVKLAREADAVAAQFTGQIPTRSQLMDITHSQGIDLATRVLYECITRMNRDFMQTIDQVQLDPSPVATGFKLVIVPALFYKERPEFGGDGTVIAEIARACGIETEVLQIQSKGACIENTEIIKSRIKQEKTSPIVLLSMSKGGAETRLALEGLQQDPASEAVRAWINLCGFVRGSPHSDQVLSNGSLKLRVRLICLALGADYRMVDELSTRNPRWLQAFALPEKLLVINLLGIPLLSHIQQRNQYNRYVRLMSLGPNDGFSFLSDMIVPNSLTYPLWGADHYFRTPQVSPLLYRVFTYLKREISDIKS
jgi:hypothetical protein